MSLVFTNPTTYEYDLYLPFFHLYKHFNKQPVISSVMPLGPKRRKAPKKKKFTTTFLRSPPTLFQGSDDLKFCGDRESDGGEISNCTPQNYHHQHSLVEEKKEEEEKRETLSILSVDPANYSEMEDSSNGKIEETQKVELLEEDNEVVIEEGVEELKTDVESLRESVVDLNSEFVNNTHDGDDSILAKLEEDKEVIDSFVESESVVPLSEEPTQIAETPAENLEASDVIEYESKENGEKILPSDGEINGFSPVVTDVVSKGIEETILSASDENTGQSSGIIDLASKENVDIMVQPDGDTGESSGIVDLVSKENVENLSQQLAVETRNDDDEQTNKSEIPESTGTKPIISMTPRVLHPTSWRNCCGLFDLLRRSSR